MTKAAQYLRMSTDSQPFSLANQAALIGAFAERHGFEIVRTYEDAGRSGMTTVGREGLLSLLRDVVSGPDYQTVLVADVSRWGRFQDLDEGAHYEFLCRQAGIQVLYCSEAFDNDGSPASVLLKNVKRMMAGEYSRQLSERTQAGVQRALRAGGRAGGQPPFGFARESFDPNGSEVRRLSVGERKSSPHHLVRLVHGSPDQVATLRRIFRMFVSDYRATPEIAGILNGEGVGHSRPGPWTTDRVRHVLQNEIAMGVLASGRSHAVLSGRRVARAREDWSRRDVVAPLVSRSVFQKAQSRLAETAATRHVDDELIATLKRILKAHGTLNRGLVVAHARASVFTYQKRFGSLPAAFALAGFVRRRRDRQHVPAAALELETVKGGLRRLLSGHGYLSAALIDRSGELPHSDTLRAHFGGLEALYGEVGFERSRSDLLKLAWERRRRHTSSRTV